MKDPMPQLNQVFSKGSTTYFTSSLFFPEKIKTDVARLYAFVRIADNYVDDIPQNKEGYYTLKEEYYRVLKGEKTENFFVHTFVELSKERKFDPLWIEAFFTSMEMDLNNHKYETIEDTEKYMYGSAGVIGLFMARILDLPEKSYEAAQSLGNAFQYVNFIRDIKEDLALHRSYFPQQELTAAGFKTLEEAEVRQKPDDFIYWIRKQISRYIVWQHQATYGFEHIPKRYLVPIKTASDMYYWTAQQIEKDPFIVYQKKVKPNKVFILAKAVQNLITVRR